MIYNLTVLDKKDKECKSLLIANTQGGNNYNQIF
jgi:hypothetical protein